MNRSLDETAPGGLPTSVLPLTLLSGLVLGFLLATAAGILDRPTPSSRASQPPAMASQRTGRLTDIAMQAPPAAESSELVWLVAGSLEQSAFLEQVVDELGKNEGTRSFQVLLVSTPEEQARLETQWQLADAELAQLSALSLPGIASLRVIDLRVE